MGQRELLRRSSSSAQHAMNWLCLFNSVTYVRRDSGAVRLQMPSPKVPTASHLSVVALIPVQIPSLALAAIIRHFIPLGLAGVARSTPTHRATDKA